jgi:protocatechuate 3,4-dioxygenase beta subunit
MGTNGIICLLALIPGADKPGVSVTPEPLRGMVHAADGLPAAGAVVWAGKITFGLLDRRETVADAKGRFALILTPGNWSVSARRGTQGGEGQRQSEVVEIVANRAPESVTIYLEERGTFRGRLLAAETGKPISGGKLFLDDGHVLKTDADGRFEVGGLHRCNHESFVVAPGRMRLRVLFDTTARADTDLEVSVPRARKIVGRVTDMNGKPIPGAYVGRSTSGSCFSTSGLFLLCDADGRFEYDDAVPPDQPKRLSAEAPGYVEAERNDLVVSPDGKLELDFQLRPQPDGRKPSGVKAPAQSAPSSSKPKSHVPAAQVQEEEKRRVVSGVVRGPDNKPVAGVVVRWGYQPYASGIQTRTDAEGRFRLTVPDKPDMLAVLPREFLPEFPNIPAKGDKDVEVQLRAGHTARGRVLDDTGKPIKDVQVIAVVLSPDPRIGNPFWLSESAVRTDAKGKFEMHGVPENAKFDFLKSDLSDVRNHHLDLASADNTVTMLYGGAVSGRVVDRDGKPIRNFRILVNSPLERHADDQSGRYFAGYCGMGVHFTSDDGSFVLTGVGAGNVFRIMAIADGHGEAVVDRVKSVPINRLSTTKPAVLRAGPPLALRVRAVTSDGKPIAQARVTLVNGQVGLDQSFSWGYHDASWEDMVRTRTGADGWARFPALSFGVATVLVQAPGYARHRFDWRNGQKELTAELAPEAVVAGVVRDGAGQPIKECYVTLSSGSGDQISASVGRSDKGRFRVTELPAGSWTLSIRGADGRATLHEDKIVLKGGETRNLKIEAKE